MKKILNFFKDIHFFEYSLYLIIVAFVCIHFDVKPVVNYIIMCVLSFAFMNTWFIEKREKQKLKKGE